MERVMEVFLMGIVTIAFAYVAKKLENLEQKVDRLQEEIVFIHHVTRKRSSDYSNHEPEYDDGLL